MRHAARCVLTASVSRQEHGGHSKKKKRFLAGGPVGSTTRVDRRLKATPPAPHSNHSKHLPSAPLTRLSPVPVPCPPAPQVTFQHRQRCNGERATSSLARGRQPSTDDWCRVAVAVQGPSRGSCLSYSVCRVLLSLGAERHIIAALGVLYKLRQETNKLSGRRGSGLCRRRAPTGNPSWGVEVTVVERWHHWPSRSQQHAHSTGVYDTVVQTSSVLVPRPNKLWAV